ncbi:hypothetical protein Q8W71_31310 [Methylobacterium sp. NEAU 140]|uniref:hypothetical protein n=1 Tax=Methylobacterium sp. NEAU 140 TaxID=3064945 RepID=UPI0027328131|nr:hypothetical protein [Methylobacterium sp. NEAU 140]MDP4027081.1 hypothetical protein [Methylobacterium sp. NEAU 140]
MPDAAPFTFPHPFGSSASAREELAALDRDAAALPIRGPIAGLVSEISRELTCLVIADRASHEAAPLLRPHGERAFQLTGSVRGMRAICHRAAGLDPRHAERRRDMIDKAWDGIGDSRGAWAA